MDGHSSIMALTNTIIDGPLVSFLRSRTVERGAPFSVTGMGNMKGKWMVQDSDYPHFLDLLHDYLFIQKRRPLNLVEQRRTDGYAPILIDLDFKYPAESAIQRRFSITNIFSFIRSYISHLTYFYDLSALADSTPTPTSTTDSAAWGRTPTSTTTTDSAAWGRTPTIRFFVSIRPSPYEDKKNSANRCIKDGVHIECPDLIIPTEHQFIIRQRFLEHHGLASSFEGTGYMNAEKDVFDDSLVKKNGWFFFGESKPDIPAYGLTAIYTYHPATGEFEESDTECYGSRQLLELLSIRYNFHPSSVSIRPEVADEWSRRQHSNAPAPRKEAEDEKGAVEESMEIFPRWLSQGYNQEEIDLAQKLVERCLSAERADNYQTWMEVGWCLHAIDSSEKMFDYWMQFSAKSSKFSSNNISQIRRDWISGWRRSTSERKFTNRSLHYWAKQDNPEEYKKIIEEDNVNFVELHVEPTHTHIARLMQRMYLSDYRAAVDSKRHDWYEYKNGCWRKLAQGLELRNKISTDVISLIDKTRQVARRRIDGLLQKTKEAEFAEHQFKKLLQIEKNLYSSGFKDSVMKECIGLFYEEEFSQKLNSNPYLIGFANGVINLRAERINADGDTEYFVEFRNGKPEDYITFMAGRWVPKNCDPIDYIPFDPESREQKEIDDFMSKVFPRKDLREYMWRKLASCLEGTNREQTYETWIGVGGNGKSKLVDLMAMSLGDYATSLQSTVLTRKRPESGAANPDIMAIRNKRFIYMAEPDDNEPLNTSRMKQFTGEDVVEARGLFEDQTKFQITGKMFMLCNKLPPIHTMDRGTWRRVRAVPFESKFVEPNSTEIDPSKNVFPRDNFLDAKLKNWRMAFMSRLVHVYQKEYLTNGIEPIPAIVKQESDKYREMFDAFGRFKQARMRTVPGECTTFSEVWRIYKNWHEMAGGKRLTQNELQKRMDDEYGVPSDKKTYRRIRLFETEEDIEAFDKGDAKDEEVSE